jgi:hypothetical protein
MFGVEGKWRISSWVRLESRKCLSQPIENPVLQYCERRLLVHPFINLNGLRIFGRILEVTINGGNCTTNFGF